MHNEVQRIKQTLRSRLGWEYDVIVIDGGDVEDEDMPVIVDMEEPYAL